MELAKCFESWVRKIQKATAKDTNKMSAEWTKLDEEFIHFIATEFPSLSHGENKLYFDFLKVRLGNTLNDKPYSFIYWIVGQKPENNKRPINGVIDWLINSELEPTLLSDVIRAEKRYVRKESMAKFVRDDEDFDDKINFLNGKLKLYNTPAILFLLKTVLEVKVEFKHSHEFLTTDKLLKIENKVAPILSSENFDSGSFQKAYMDQYWLDKFRNLFKDQLNSQAPALEHFKSFIDGYFNNMALFKDTPIYEIAAKFNLSGIDPDFGQVISSKLYVEMFKDTIVPDEVRACFFHQKLVDGQFIEKQTLAEFRLDNASLELSQLEEMVYSLVTRLFKASNAEAEKATKMALSTCLRTLSQFRTPLGPGVVSILFSDAMIWKLDAIKSDSATELTPDSLFKKLEPILNLMKMPQSQKDGIYQQLKQRISPDYIQFQRDLIAIRDHKDLLKLLGNLPKAFDRHPIAQIIKMKAEVAENADDIDKLINFYKSDLVKIFKVFQDNIETADALMWRNLASHKELFFECVKRITELHSQMNRIKKDFKVA